MARIGGYTVWETCTGGWRFVAIHRTLGSAQRQVEAIRADRDDPRDAMVGDRPPVDNGLRHLAVQPNRD